MQIAADEGWICLPVLADDETKPSAEIEACAWSVGAYVCPAEFGRACFIVCPSGSNDECGGGTYCDPQYHLCVWPSVDIPWPPGETDAGTTTVEPNTTTVDPSSGTTGTTTG